MPDAPAIDLSRGAPECWMVEGLIKDVEYSVLRKSTSGIFPAPTLAYFRTCGTRWAMYARG